MLDPLSWSSSKILRKHHLLPSSFHWAHIKKIECVPQVANLQSSACFLPQDQRQLEAPIHKFKNNSISKNEDKKLKDLGIYWVIPRDIWGILWLVWIHKAVWPIRVYYFILPCSKMRICFHERTRKAVSMARRRTLLLFRRWSLKVQLIDIFTKVKTKKVKDEDARHYANWFWKERKLPMLQECQLNNPAIEFGQIQDSLLLSPKQHG